MHLTEPPTEILIHILSHVTWFDIVACSYVNKQWHSLACAEYLYKDLYFTSSRNMDACLTVFEETALKRNWPSRQSEYSSNNYGHFVRGIHLAQTMDIVDYNVLLNLLKHCPFVHDMKIGHHGLTDEHLACIRQTCPNLRRLDTTGCGLVTWKGLLDQQFCNPRIALESLTTGLCFELWSTPPLSIAPGTPRNWQILL
ncbi:hypothetical protein BC943DRAFT_351235 [Umbelopsis sp. AD052]|nr:hypothetical protein BC943DRAFT_351235 [Umbelopsis sp. AD052]